MFKKYRKNKILKLGEDVILPFLHEIKKQLEKRKILSDVYKKEYETSVTFAIEIYEKIKCDNDRIDSTDWPFFIGCSFKKIFGKPINVDDADYYIGEINKELLSDKMNKFVKSTKITETEIIGNLSEIKKIMGI